MPWPFDIPAGGFRAIVADPPWSYQVFSEKGKGRSAERHYSCMTLGDIARLPVAEIAARDAHLFLWIPGPFLVVGAHLQIMSGWGFKPCSDVFYWLKTKKGVLGTVQFVSENIFYKGMGFTTRKNAESVVLGRKGLPRRNTKSMHQLILAPRREHSRKPDEVYARVEEYCDGPYLNLFARESRGNWTTWGNENTKFDEVSQ